MSVPIHDLAKILGVTARDILDAVEKLGIEGKKFTLSSLTDEEADQIKTHFRDRKVPPRIVPSFCSFCGDPLEVEEYGTLEKVRHFAFICSHGHRRLVACLKCLKFFCNLCGKQIEEIKVRTVKGDTAGEVVYVPSYYYEDTEMHEALLFCNDCLHEPNRPANKACGHDSHSLPDECRVCPKCKVLVQRELVQYDAECPGGCEHLIRDVEEYPLFHCSFCGTEIKRDEEKGILVDAAPIRFQSPVHWCKTLVACSTCQPKHKNKKSDQFFCSMCGKEIKGIVAKDARDKLEYVVIYDVECGTIFVCNAEDCLEKAGEVDCMFCPFCRKSIHHHAGDPNMGECANCGQLAHGAEVQAAPELYKERTSGH